MSLIKETQVNAEALSKLQASQRELSFFERSYKTGGLTLFGTVIYSLMGIGLIHGAISAIACAIQAKSTDSLVQDFAAKQIQVLDQQAVERTPGAFKASQTPQQIRQLNAELNTAASALVGRVSLLTNDVSNEEARDVIKAARFMVEQQVKKSSDTKSTLAVSQDFRALLAKNVIQQAYETLGGQEITDEDYQATIKSLVEMKLFDNRSDAAAAFKNYAAEQLGQMTDREFNKVLKAKTKESVLRKQARVAKDEKFEKVQELGKERAELNKQITQKNTEIKKLEKEVRDLQLEAGEFDDAVKEAQTELKKLVRQGKKADQDEIDVAKAERDEATLKAREARDNIRAKSDEIVAIQRDMAILMQSRDKKQHDFKKAAAIFRNVHEYAGEKKHKFPTKPQADQARVESMIRERANADVARLRALKGYKAPGTQTESDVRAAKLVDLRLALAVVSRLSGDKTSVTATNLKILEKANVFGELYARCGNGSSEQHWARKHFNDSVETVTVLQAIIESKLDVLAHR
ncbi:MAG: hypothetical protein KGZ39_02160 [Simkania sp.]|nr:hypothetical protein [Simkania sp.]